MLSPPLATRTHVQPWACGPETLRQWPPRRFPSSTKPSLGPWDPPSTPSQPRKGPGLGPINHHTQSPCPPTRRSVLSFLSATQSIINHHHHPHSHPPTQPPTPPHHLAGGGPNRDPHFSSPPLQPTATLSAHRQPRHFQSFSPKIVLVATNRPARILGPSPHSFLVLADHTRDNRCGSFDSSEGVDTPARPGVPD